MSWGSTWGVKWGGGGPAPAAAAAVAPARTAVLILGQLSGALVATGAGLRPCGYRQPIERTPVGAAERQFEVMILGSRNERGLFGAGRTTLDLELRVKVSYAVLGGDAGGGDRKSVNVRAGSDAALIMTCLTDPRNWNRDVTGIRNVRAGVALGLVYDAGQLQVWESRFQVETWFDWPG